MFYRILMILFLVASGATAYAQQSPDDGATCTNEDGQIVECASGVNLEP